MVWLHKTKIWWKTNFFLHRYRLLLKGKNKKFIGVIKDEIGEKIIKQFFGLRTKTYSYLIDGR